MLRALSLSFCTLFILVFISSSAFALLKCPDGDPKLWDQCSGVTDLADGRRYWGEFRRGVPEGKGKYLGSDGALYVGDIKAGIGEGNGVTTFKDGRVIEGLYKAGKPIGKVRITDRDQSVYFGDIENGLRSGSGKIVYVDGLLYTGSFREDKKNGRGILEYPSGDRYEGEFRDDEPTDKGELKFANGDIYRGSFLHYRPSGRGTLKLNSGAEFTGQFQDGMPNGNGELRAKNGVVIRRGIFNGVVNVRTSDTDLSTYSLSQAWPLSVSPIATDGSRNQQSALNLADANTDALIKKQSSTSNVRSDDAVSGDRQSASSTWPPLPPERPKDDDEGVGSNVLIPSQDESAQSVQTLASSEASSNSVSDPERMEVMQQVASDNKTSGQSKGPPNSKLADESIKVPIASPPQSIKTTSPNGSAESSPTREPILKNFKFLIPDINWSHPAQSPLQCQYGGDLFFNFVNCTVSADNIMINDIIFNDGSCPSGQNYIAIFDALRNTSWLHLLSKLKAYFYYGPFDFRGEKNRGDRVVFLVADCRGLERYSILSRGVTWTWSRLGSEPK